LQGVVILIAEIGVNYFGSLKKAKQLIKAAHESGADLIKSQVFRAEDIKHGSMPFVFYKTCELKIEEYIELIEYARDLGNDLFYSIFSPGFEKISMHQTWHKVAGIQTKQGKISQIHDQDNVIISVPGKVDVKTIPRFEKSEYLYVSEYMTDEPRLEFITYYSHCLDKQFGYSDHTIGIDYAKAAVQSYGAQIVEKHFTLKKSEKFKGKVFRDTVHGSTPDEFERLAVFMSQQN
jgi:N,N'-diacetyllegionaminate synthase